MRCVLFFTVLYLTHFSSFSQAPHGKLYFYTVPGGAIHAYLGYIEYPDETYKAIDSFLFDHFGDIAMIDDKLFVAKLDDVTGYDTVNYLPVETVFGVNAQRIAGWNGKLATTSYVSPFFRVYDVPSSTLLFSLDSSRLPNPPADFAVWDNKAFLLMASSVIIVDLLAQDTFATIATPHPYLNQDFNYYLIDAGADFYIDVEYATGALRFSLLKMNKTTYTVETVFHHEGYSNYSVPVVADDRIYFGPFDTHYSISDDSLHISNDQFAPLPVEYDEESASLFLYHYTPNSISYFAGGVFPDTLLMPYYISRALFVPWMDLCDAFCVTNIKMDSTNTNLEITIFLDADSTVFINYPYVTAVTDANGDTVATGNMNFFGQFGGTSQTYTASTSLDSVPAGFNATVHFSYDTSVCALWYPCSDTCSFTPTVSGDVLLCPDESGELTTQVYDSYQWYKREFFGTAQPIAGATSQTLAIDQFNDGGYYFSVEATDNGCTERSAEILVDSWVFLLPVVETTGDFTTGINGETIICEGDTAYYSLLLPYDTLITWYKNGSPLTGITGNTLTVNDSGFYSVEGAPSVCPGFIQQLGVTLEVQVDSCSTGVNTSNEISWKCYWSSPENTIYIKNIPAKVTSIDASLYSPDGKLLKQEIIFPENTVARWSLSLLSQGTYICRLHDGNTLIAMKFSVIK